MTNTKYIPTISLCMIVKDEEDTLDACLRSVSDLVEEIIIVDTGSTDQTKEIARRYTDKIFHFTWVDDFSAARNFSFEQATMDYILWLDADDVMLEEDRAKFRSLKENFPQHINAIVMNYHIRFDASGNPSLSAMRARLVKRACNFRWYGRVHEALEIAPPAASAQIAITHRKQKQPTDRNLNIYKKMEEETVSFTASDLFHYAAECMIRKNFTKAIELYQQYLLHNHEEHGSRTIACCNLAECYYMLGQKKEAISHCLQSFEYDLPRAEIVYLLGTIFLEEKEYHKALFWLDLCTRLPLPMNETAAVSYSHYTWRPHLQMCVCYFELGNYERAYAHVQEAYTISPQEPGIIECKQTLEEIMNRLR